MPHITLQLVVKIKISEIITAVDHDIFRLHFKLLCWSHCYDMGLTSLKISQLWLLYILLM